MRVDIQPQWQKLANWYWEKFDQSNDSPHMSIWDVLERDYGAFKVSSMTSVYRERGMWVKFPDEKSYTMFVLRWS